MRRLIMIALILALFLTGCFAHCSIQECAKACKTDNVQQFVNDEMTCACKK